MIMGNCVEVQKFPSGFSGPGQAQSGTKTKPKKRRSNINMNTPEKRTSRRLQTKPCAVCAVCKGIKHRPSTDPELKKTGERT